MNAPFPNSATQNPRPKPPEKPVTSPRRIRYQVLRVLHPAALPACYWIALAVDENTVLALEPIKRIVPTTMTRITANITAYLAISWASSSRNTFQRRLIILPPPVSEVRVANCKRVSGGVGTAKRESELSRANCWPSPRMHHKLCTSSISLSSKLQSQTCI